MKQIIFLVLLVNSLVAVDIYNTKPQKKELLGMWLSDDFNFGFTLYKDGYASSINSSTLIYHNWWIDGEKLCLRVRSIGNHTQSVEDECHPYFIEYRNSKTSKLHFGNETFHHP